MVHSILGEKNDGLLSIIVCKHSSSEASCHDILIQVSPSRNPCHPSPQPCSETFGYFDSLFLRIGYFPRLFAYFNRHSISRLPLSVLFRSAQFSEVFFSFTVPSQFHRAGLPLKLYCKQSLVSDSRHRHSAVALLMM